MSAVLSVELAVGEPVRRLAGRAIVASLAVAAVFGVVTVVSKETPALEVRQPWQDDPYDVLVSLDFVALPLLVTELEPGPALCDGSGGDGQGH